MISTIIKGKIGQDAIIKQIGDKITLTFEVPLNEGQITALSNFLEKIGYYRMEE